MLDVRTPNSLPLTVLPSRVRVATQHLGLIMGEILHQERTHLQLHTMLVMRLQREVSGQTHPLSPPFTSVIRDSHRHAAGLSKISEQHPRQPRLTPLLHSVTPGIHPSSPHPSITVASDLSMFLQQQHSQSSPGLVFWLASLESGFPCPWLLTTQRGNYIQYMYILNPPLALLLHLSSLVLGSAVHAEEQFVPDIQYVV